MAANRLDLEVHGIAGGHLPMFSRPAELAQRLVELWTDERAQRSPPPAV